MTSIAMESVAWTRDPGRKPARQILLERLHSALWREKTAAHLAATVQADWADDVWGIVKDVFGAL